MKKVFGYHIGNRLDIKKLKSAMVFETLHSDLTELFYKTDQDGLIYIFDYGSIVFLDINQTEHSGILNQIRDISGIKSLEPETEVFDIEIDQKKEYKVLFNQQKWI